MTAMIQKKKIGIFSSCYESNLSLIQNNNVVVDKQIITDIFHVLNSGTNAFENELRNAQCIYVNK